MKELEVMLENLKTNPFGKTTLTNEKLATLIEVALGFYHELEEEKAIPIVDLYMTNSTETKVYNLEEFVKTPIIGDVKVDAGDLKYLLSKNAEATETIGALRTKMTTLNDTVVNLRNNMTLVKELGGLTKSGDDIANSLLIAVGKNVNTLA